VAEELLGFWIEGSLGIFESKIGNPKSKVGSGVEQAGVEARDQTAAGEFEA
jgi:hypothetical protein